MIQLKQINKSFYTRGQVYKALSNVSLEVNRNEIFGVLGKSGAGKSTLLRCVNLLEKPDSGQVIVNGYELDKLPINKLREQRHKIGMIFQHFNLLESRTVFQNIALPLEILRKSSREITYKVNALLELVGISDQKDRYPFQLSGGQKQRVAIARALATDPNILLSDEATSALDTQATQSVLELLKRINQELGLTILLITHELEVVKQICDRVAIVDHGQIVEEGRTINVLVNPQRPVTKELVQQAIQIPRKAEPNTQLAKSESSNALLVKLTFIGEESDKPLISFLIKNFSITVNILQAQIERIDNTTVGFTVCELSGDNIAIKQALQYINATSVKVEVINHA